MKDQIPLLGMETEYGIIREDLEDSDPVEESMKLLKSFWVTMIGIIFKTLVIRSWLEK